MGSSSTNRGENKKYLSCHQLVKLWVKWTPCGWFHHGSLKWSDIGAPEKGRVISPQWNPCIITPFKWVMTGSCPPCVLRTSQLIGLCGAQKDICDRFSCFGCEFFAMDMDIWSLVVEKNTGRKLKKHGSISKGKDRSSKHYFSGDVLVFAGVFVIEKKTLE